MAIVLLRPLWLLCLGSQLLSSSCSSHAPLASLQHHSSTLALLELMGEVEVSCSLLTLPPGVKAEVLGLWRDRGRPEVMLELQEMVELIDR